MVGDTSLPSKVILRNDDPRKGLFAAVNPRQTGQPYPAASIHFLIIVHFPCQDILLASKVFQYIDYK